MTLILGCRILFALLGLLAFYLGAFSYENEEGRWINRLDELWITVDEQRASSRLSSMWLLKKLSSAITLLSDHAFGKRLISFQAIAVTLNLSLCGAFLFALSQSDRLSSRLTWLYCAIAACVIGIVSLTERNRFQAFLAVGTAIFLILRVGPIGHAWQLGESVALIVSLITDIIAVALLRRCFAKLAESFSMMKMTFVVLVILGFALCALVLPWFLPLAQDSPSDSTLVFSLLSFSLNLFTALYCFSPALLLIILVLHIGLWPTLSRLLYPAARYRLLANKKFLLTFAMLSLTFAFAVTTSA